MSAKVVTFFKRNLLLLATIFIMILCLVSVSILSGYIYKTSRIGGIVINTILVMVVIFVLGDTIKFLILAIDKAWWPRHQDSYTVDRSALVHTRTHYLKMRLNILRSQLLASDKHCIEPLNLMYQSISTDVWLYGRYFFLLMCVVLVTYDELLYYNTMHMQSLFVINQTRSWGLEKVGTFHEFYLFLEKTLVAPFDPDDQATGKKTWIYGDHTAKMGVVRLRQLRKKEGFHMGWNDPEFTNEDYMPGWERPFQRMPYTNKYWKIFSSWLPIYPRRSAEEKFFLNYKHYAYAHEFPELYGYVTLLARTYNSSMKIIDYLENMNWLTDQGTLALFVDFTLFNTDSNIFTVVTLTIERTTFGTLEYYAEFDSAKLLILDQIRSVLIVVIVFLYIMVLIQYGKSIIIMLWFEPFKFRSLWNKLDLLIILLNVLLLCLLITHQVILNNLVNILENASILVFLDFRIPARLHTVLVVMLGFLVCITTLRLWRVLQFARVFQMISATLYAAWKALASTAMLILIFLVGYGMAVGIINGNYSITFVKLTKSITSSVSFALGFKRHINPVDLLHGGRFVGIILYAILAFFIVILMMNLFASTINDYFCNVRHKEDARIVPNQITFLQFLRVEYAPLWRIFFKLPCCRRGYKRRNRTVHQNIELALNSKDKAYNQKTMYHVVESRFERLQSRDIKEDKLKHEKYKERIERMHTVAALMQTQMDLLEHMLFTQDRALADFDESMMNTESESDYEYRRK